MCILVKCAYKFSGQLAYCAYNYSAHLIFAYEFPNKVSSSHISAFLIQKLLYYKTSVSSD